MTECGICGEDIRPRAGDMVTSISNVHIAGENPSDDTVERQKFHTACFMTIINRKGAEDTIPRDDIMDGELTLKDLTGREGGPRDEF